MDPELLKRMEQFDKFCGARFYGSGIQNTFNEYSSVENNISKSINGIKEFYSMNMLGDDYHLPYIFYQDILITYRDSIKKDPSVGDAILNSFFNDFFSTSNTLLYPKFESVAESVLAFNSCSTSNNYPLIMQISKKLMQSINEFINALLGFLIIGWRCANGKKYSINIFNNNYGSKLDEFKELTNGNDGIFYFIFRLGSNHLRNALAHDDIYFDQENMVVKYNDREKSFTMNTVDYMAILLMGATLPKAYQAALNTIYVINKGSQNDKNYIDSNILRLLNS